MRFYSGILSLLINFIPQLLAATSDTFNPLSVLPTVNQNTNVHTLAKTYCRQLWKQINAPSHIGYKSMDSQEFKIIFQGSTDAFQNLLNKIKENEPINDSGEYFDINALPKLQTALDNMKVLGKHKSTNDQDNETQAHVNEIFVYCWSQTLKDPSKLTPFLIGLQDASPTCIQGYSVRMLCAVHPPKQKGQK